MGLFTGDYSDPVRIGSPSAGVLPHLSDDVFEQSRLGDHPSMDIVGGQTEGEEIVTGVLDLGPGVVGLIPRGWEDDHGEEKASHP